MQLQAHARIRVTAAPCLKTGTKSRSRARGVRVVLAAASDGTSAVNTPHSHYHLVDEKNNPFFEGWYWKVDTPEGSFALMYSIEHPDSDNKLRGMGVQVMGPGDEYLCQYTKDTSSFWGARDELALGGCFRSGTETHSGSVPQAMVSEDRFNDAITQGFQASYTWHQGSIVSDDNDCKGSIPNFVDSAEWAFNIRPVYGWGDSGAPQKATAGWLASLPIFEPQWQVLMAHGLADGWLKWGDRLIEFSGAPSYSEKNWGSASFPDKWFWMQCNSFDGQPDLCVTGVGAKRGLGDSSNGISEDVGMIGIHTGGRFLELVPWKGKVEWEVDPWGRWRLWAKNDDHEALIECSVATTGTVLRAPTGGDGLAPICRDAFEADCRLRVWAVDGSGRRKSETPTIDAMSGRAAVEVGGGPWVAKWKATAQMAAPIAAALNADVDGVVDRLSGSFDPRDAFRVFKRPFEESP